MNRLPIYFDTTRVMFQADFASCIRVIHTRNKPRSPRAAPHMFDMTVEW